MYTLSNALILFIMLGLGSCYHTPPKVHSSWKLHVIDSTLYGADGIRAGYFDEDSLVDFISGGEEYGATRVFLNQGNLQFDFLEFPSPSVEDALFTDLDEDGTPEVFTFSEGDTRHIALHFKDTGSVWRSEVIPATEGIAWMYGAVADLDEDGTKEIIVGAKGENGVIGWLATTPNPADFAQWKLHPIAPVAWVMSIEYLDMDADGYQDVLISDRKGAQSGIKWFKHPDADNLSQPWSATLIGLQGKEPMFLEVVDFNGDGQDDIIVADIAEGIFFFEKIDKSGKHWKDSLLFTYPDFVGRRGKSVACVNIDTKEDLEIVTSYAEADNESTLAIVTSYEEAENAYGVIYSKYNKATAAWDHFPISSTAGIKYDKILPLDIDQDGDLDIFTTEERENGNGLGVIWYENPSTK